MAERRNIRRDEEYDQQKASEAVVVPFKLLTPNELIDLKENLLNVAAAALISAPKVEINNPTIIRITRLIKGIAYYDPEFVLKVALYLRLDLNIRSTANYVLAVASNIRECQPYVRRYFSHAIRLPSDWLDVAATYHILPDRLLVGKALPTCLRKAMVDRFPQFDAYQLGKYNKERTIKKKLKILKANGPQRGPPQKPMLTLKQMIRQLHLSSPPLNVMSLLGKKYPETESLFQQAGLPGDYDYDLAGKRMKLPTAETWETLLSAKGNKSSTWEELIEHKKLPFMAMLRNIRNLINTGVHPKYHRWVQNKLRNEMTIASSRQFPFAFFSAYEVIPKTLAEFDELIASMNNNIASKASKDEKKGGDDVRRKRKNPIITTNRPTQKIFDDYRSALDQSVILSTTRNVQPIRGSSVVFCAVGDGVSSSAPGARNMGSSVRSVAEIGYLLGLMCKYVCEECDFRVWSSPSHQSVSSHLPVTLLDGTILDNMKVVAEVAAKLGSTTGPFPFEYIRNLIRDKKHIDNFLILSSTPINPNELKENGTSELADLLSKYRQEVNPDMLFVSVDLSGGRKSVDADEKNPLDICISGFSDQILRFIAERGDQTQLQYVEHIAEAKGFQKSEAELAQQRAAAAVPISPWWKWLDNLDQDAPKPANFTALTCGEPWQEARVFISSTFLDFHGERDILTRTVFPILRERARERRIRIVEVDLRWGITAEESQGGKQIALCLNEVDRCKPFFVGMLGERYGWAPEEYDVPEKDQFKWLKSFPKGRSITELEMTRAALQDPSSSSAIFFLRDGQFHPQVPEEYRANFESASAEDTEKMNDLKERIQQSGHTVTTYRCDFDRISEDKALVKGLEYFADSVEHQLWNAIEKEFPLADPVTHPLEVERLYHQSYAIELAHSFLGRKDALSHLERFEQGHIGRLLVLEGAPGEGKSALLAKYSQSLATASPTTFVLTHYVGASVDSLDIRATLERLCRELRDAFDLDYVVPEDYMELCNTFTAFLAEACFKGKVVIIIDAIDQLDPTLHSAHSLDWLPSSATLPCKVIVSCLAGSQCAKILKRRGAAHPSSQKAYSLPPLDVKERKLIVETTLGRFHKKLDDKPMNTQMRVLLRKVGASSPLYLKVACEELRVFGVYERVSEKIKSLGDRLPKLFDGVLQRLEEDHSRQTIQGVCGLIHASRGGLLSFELCELLKITSARWSGIYRSLSAFLKPSGSSGKLAFFHSQFSLAVEKRYANGKRALRLLHMQLANYFYDRADSDRNGTWSGANDERSLLALPYHLLRGEMYPELSLVLCDLTYIEIIYSLGVSPLLINHYNDATAAGSRYTQLADVMAFKTYIKANDHVLKIDPSLALQQAANQPDNTAPAKKATALLATATSHSWLRWDNKPSETDPVQMTLAGYRTKLTASAFSPQGTLFAVATRDCDVIIYDTATGVETSRLSGHSQWIVDIQFMPSSRDDELMLATASWDGTARFWDVTAGQALASLDAHSRRVNSVAFNARGDVLATGGWDNKVHLWQVSNISVRDSYQMSTFMSDDQPATPSHVTHYRRSWRTVNAGSRPVNTVVFSADDRAVLVGSWDGKITEYDAESGEKLGELDGGHDSSCTSLACAPSGKHLVSGSKDKKLVLWDAHAKKMIATLSEHAQPVTRVAYSHDGQHLLSASDDATTKVWNANLGCEVRSMMAPNDSYMNCLAFAPGNDAILACGSSDCKLVVYNFAEGTVPRFGEAHSRPIISLSFSHNGKNIATSSEDGEIFIWDAVTLKKVRALTGHRGSVNCLDWCRSGNYNQLVSASDDFSIRVWDTRTGKVLKEYTGHTAPVKHCLFGPKGRMVISASRDGSVRMWDTLKAQEDGEIRAFRGHLDWLNACHINAAGTRIVSCGWDFTIKLWNANKGTEKGTMEGHTGSVSLCRFSPDARTVVSSGFDNDLKIWDSESCTELTTLSGHESRVNSFCFNNKGDAIASVSDDGCIKVWNPLAATEVRTLVGHAGAIRGASFSPQGLIATASDDRSLKLWDVGLAAEETSTSYGASSFSFASSSREPEEVSVEFDLKLHTSQVNGLSLNRSSSQLLSAADDGKFALWDLNKKLKLRTIDLGMPVNDIVFQKDSDQMFATASASGEVTLWDTRQQQRVRVVTKHDGAPATSVSFDSATRLYSGSWNGKTVVSDPRYSSANNELKNHVDWVTAVSTSNKGNYGVSGGWDNTLYLYDLSKKQKKYAMKGHAAPITSVSFSADSSRFSSASKDGTVRVWDTSGRNVKTLLGHRGGVNATAFGGTHLLSAGDDHLVKLWNPTTGRVLNQFLCVAPATACVQSLQSSSNDVIAAGDRIGNIYLVSRQG